MALIQPVSEERTTLDEARAAVLAVRLAELMGLYTRPAGARIDRGVVEQVAQAVAVSGLADRVGVGFGERPRTRRLVRPLLAALEASPAPAPEIRNLAAILGLERLAELAGTSTPSLRRYAAGERATPDPVAQRIHFLAILVALLRGSFNEFGVRRWFERPRSALDGQAPGELLAGTWDPDDPGPRGLRELAEGLLS